MVLDTMKHAAAYAGLHAGVDMALKAMAAYTPENYETGKVELDGDKVFLLRNAYTTHDSAEAKMEAHRAYIDVMYMVEGEETIYVKPTDGLRSITMQYTPEQDALLAELDGDVTAVRLSAGSFIVLLPQDAHAPGCMVDCPKTVKKIIAKVRV